VADEPTRFSLRTVIVLVASLVATGVSVYRISDAFKQETPPPSPMQEMIKENPEYVDLVSAIREHDVGHVRQALTKNPWLANFSKPESGLSAPLVVAAVSNQPEIVDLLVDHGADVNAKGRWGGTALHWAAWRGSADAVDALIHRGADVKARSDNDGSTPLFWACRASRASSSWSRTNHSAAVRILLDSGADPETANRDGFYADAVASEEIAALLVQHGAKARPAATQPTFGTSTGEFGHFGMGWGFRHHERER
jgi:hypothetical protein